MNNTQVGTQYYPPLRNQVVPTRNSRVVHVPAYRPPPTARGDALAAAQLRAQSRQAEIASMAERDRATLEQKDQIEKARREAAVVSQQAKEAAAQSLIQTKTNSDWNLHMANQREAANRPTTEIMEKVPGMTLPVKRKVTDAEFQKIKTQAQIDELTNERSGLSPTSWFGLGKGDSARIGEIDKKLEALNQPPADLLQSNDMIQPGAVAAPVAKPQGFIGTPGGDNVFLDQQPLGLNRAQTNAYAAALNRGDNPSVKDYAPRAQADRLVSPAGGLPPTWNPNYGALQDEQSQSLGSPTYQGNAAPASAKPQIPQAHIEHLLMNPETASDFDAKYGDGASRQYLKD